MAEYFIEDTTLINIADRVRTLSNTDETMTPAEMINKLDVIVDEAVLLKKINIELPADARWYSVCYGNGTYVAVAYNSNIAATSKDGITWTKRTLPEVANWRSVCFGNGVFVAIAAGSSVAAYSLTGTLWNPVNLLSADQWYSVSYGNSKFVAVASRGTSIAYSSSGSGTWTPIILAQNMSGLAYQSLCFGGGYFVSLAFNSNAGIYSANGTSWQPVTLPARDTWTGIAYGNNRFVAVASQSNVAMYTTSSSPTNWKVTTLPANSVWYSVCYGNGKFVAVGGTNVAYSQDGITWNLSSVPVSVYSVVYGGGKFIAASTNGHLVAYSVDGVNWYDYKDAYISSLTGEDITSEVAEIACDTAPAKTITPTTSAQIAVSSGKYTTGDITVAAMPMTARAVPEIGINQSGLITATSTQSAGYVEVGIETSTMQLTTRSGMTITPTKSSQVAVESGVLTTGDITVAAIPNQYITTTDATAVAGNILADKTAYVNGVKIKGTMTNNGAVSQTIEAGSSYTIPAGYHNGLGVVAAADSVGSGNFGTITFSGNHTGSLYYTESGCKIVTDLGSQMAFLILQSGTSATYCNIYPDSVKMPSGVSFLNTNSPEEVSGSDVGTYHTFVFTGVTQVVNASIVTDSRDASAEGIMSKITISYA